MNDHIKKLAKIDGDLRNLIVEFWDLESLYLNKHGIKMAEENREDIKKLEELSDKIRFFLGRELTDNANV